LKIWIDILTPKQLLFSEHIIEKLYKNHDIICTSRSYREVSKLAKIRNFDLIFIGKYGGNEKYAKLEASIERTKKLMPLINKFAPDLTISFCSPEAARISYGIGIKHIAFCDSPHATAVMKLTLPLIQKLLIPWIIPKKEFVRFGIDAKNIISYRAIDAAVTIKKSKNKSISLPFRNNNKRNILIRLEEEEAAYVLKSEKSILIIKEIINEFHNENIVILGRYYEQVKKLKNLFANSKIKIIEMSFNGNELLNETDVFVGSGGTMTAESALLGVPTISYNAVPNIIENYLVKKNLLKRETNPKKIVKMIKKSFMLTNDNQKKRTKKIINNMEDPIQKLTKLIGD
jgi:hypothetical protein